MIVIGGSISLADLENLNDDVSGDDEFYQELANEEEELEHSLGSMLLLVICSLQSVFTFYSIYWSGHLEIHLLHYE